MSKVAWIATLLGCFFKRLFTDFEDWRTQPSEVFKAGGRVFALGIYSGRAKAPTKLRERHAPLPIRTPLAGGLLTGKYGAGSQRPAVVARVVGEGGLTKVVAHGRDKECAHPERDERGLDITGVLSSGSKGVASKRSRTLLPISTRRISSFGRCTAGS
jgi:hypothetical protein